MLQYKIPQDVQQADKIVGPLTMKQLIICALGFGTAYMFYITLAKTYFMEVWGPPVGISVIITILFAFVEIKGIPFAKWIILMIEANMLPHMRVWDKRQSTQFIYATLPSNVNNNKKKKKSKEELLEEKIEEKREKAKDISSLSSALDVSGFLEKDLPVEIQEEKTVKQKTEGQQEKKKDINDFLKSQGGGGGDLTALMAGNVK